jgi:sulfur carrier protein ThiS
MKITVKVHGTLMKYIADYDHEKGLMLEFPDNTDAAALIDYLGIPGSKIGMLSVNGQRVKPDYPLPDKAIVKVFQPIFGG